MSGIILLVLLIIFALIGVPLCYALGASAISYLIFVNPDFLAMVPQRVWAGTNSYVMVALPLFILAGELMNRGGITDRIINFSLYLVRPFRGGLGEVNVVASMIFGGISGSSVADTSAIGSILIPQMEKKGYPKGFATGVTVASSTMGMIIPPSVPMLTYAMVSGASVGDLFLAGLIPGVLIGLSQMTVVYMISKKKKYHPEFGKFDRKDFKRKTKDGMLAILMPLVIIITVSFGIATASESAGIAVLYSLVIGFFVYKELDLKSIPKVLKNTFVASSSVMIIIGFSMIFGWIMAIEQIPTFVANFFMSLEINRIFILLILDAIILFIGTFMDVTPALTLLTPILLPVMRAFGIDELQFGAIMITGLAIGLVTPPLGMCLNAANKISGMSISKIFKSALPFVICNVVILLLATFIPEVSIWLPSVF
ncbi:TRAP transporter large permease [Clostridium sp. DL1XJH146]